MDGRNDEANNRYGLRNREHNNRNDVLSINIQGSGNKEDDEEEIDRPHQMRRVDEANNKDPEEMMDVPFGSDIESRRKRRRSRR